MQIVLPWIAAGLCLLMGGAAVYWRPTALVSWLFLTGMALLAAERLLELQVALVSGAGDPAGWLTASLLVKSLVPGVWLAFSLVYARGNRGEFLRGWKWILVAALTVPPGIVLGFGALMIEPGAAGDPAGMIRFLPLGKLWVISLLLLTLGILVNLEKTFRASVGISRWRIKYLFLGTAMIFGVKLYTLSQVLLFSGFNPALANLSTVAVVLGSAMIAIGHSRASFDSLDLYPSRAVLQGSLTVILAGAYFIIIGLLAQVVALLGGIASFPAQALVVLVGVIGLTVLLLSDRFRTWLQRFVSRHFRRPEHDFRKIWTEFTRRTSNVLDPSKLGANAAEVVSECFHVLGVTVFQVSPESPLLVRLHSTAEPQRPVAVEIAPEPSKEIAERGRPFDLERESGSWAKGLREACGRQFEHGGDRWVVPLVGADELVGLLVLADRVNGVPYSHEELDLLQCIGDQLAAGLLNCSLTEEVLQAKELEAFQTLSTFFVHDLKNAANSLSLMLQNLPVHFDDPEFRADAVRGIGRTVERINQMILKLSSLRHELQLRREPCRLDLLAAEVLDGLGAEVVGPEPFERDLREVPELSLDREAMRSVLTNLVINAREASPQDRKVKVATAVEDGRLILKVEDEGCGMDPEFIRSQLFRPFHSTKSKGLGIGMFQCKKIIEAHHGRISVESAQGSGSRFTLLLPLSPGSPS